MAVDPSDEAQGPNTCAVEGCGLRITPIDVGQGRPPVFIHVDPSGHGWSRQLPPGHQATPRP